MLFPNPTSSQSQKKTIQNNTNFWDKIPINKKKNTIQINQNGNRKKQEV